jgi:DNA topoisomerase-1
MRRLRRADCSEAGIRRRGRGRGFEYLDADGSRITDEGTVSRIAELAIPPAWTDVWICRDSLGHIQATGLDDAGRKQYLYHERWRLRRDQQKFEQMVEFGQALPKLRRRVTSHLSGRKLDRRRVLACAVRLLDRGLFRIGGEDYAEDNGSFGLATLRKRHVSLSGREVVFSFDAKGGQRQVQSVVDPKARQVIAALKKRRGGPPDLLAYRSNGNWKDVRSEEINDYIKELSGDGFSAKDFRTWHATVLAAVVLAMNGEPPKTKTGRKQAITAAVGEVAALLGNTPAVCRRSYIDPRVFDRYRNGQTIADALTSATAPEEVFGSRAQARIERAVLGLIAD